MAADPTLDLDVAGITAESKRLAEKIKPGKTKYDVIVVGSGAAGDIKGQAHRGRRRCGPRSGLAGRRRGEILLAWDGALGAFRDQGSGHGVRPAWSVGWADPSRFSPSAWKFSSSEIAYSGRRLTSS